MSSTKSGVDRRTFISRTAAAGTAAVATSAVLGACSGNADDETVGGDDYTPGSAELQVDLAPEIDGINYPDGYVGPKARDLEPFGDGDTEFTMLSQTDPDLDLQTNYYSGLVEEKTGVKVNYQTVPAGEDGKTKVNAIMSGGELPDAMMVGQDIFNISEVSVYGEQGLFLPLDKLIDENAPHIVDMFDNFEGFRDRYTSPDGKLYAVPTMNDCYHCKSANIRTWINSRWLDGVGASAPESLSEYESLMDEFRSFSGKPDGSVLTTCSADNIQSLFQFFLGSFLEVPSLWTRRNGSTLEYVQADDAFRDGVIWIQTQFENGNFDQGMFSHTEEQYQKLADGIDGPQFGLAWGYSTFSFSTSSNYSDPDSVALIMQPIAPMEGPAGVRTAAWEWFFDGYPNFVISSECQDPVQMIRWADYQFELGLSISLTRGEQGIGWEYSDEGTEGIDGRQATYGALPGADDQDNAAWREWGPTYKSSDMRLAEEVLEESASVEPILYRAGELYEPHAVAEESTVPELIYTIDQAAEQGEISTNLTDAFTQAMADFGTGKKDASKDEDWQAYQDQCSAIGIERLIEIQQESYDRQFG